MSPNDLPEPTKAELLRAKHALLRYISMQTGEAGPRSTLHHDHTAALLDLVDALLTPTMVTGFLMGLDELIAEAKA